MLISKALSKMMKREMMKRERKKMKKKKTTRTLMMEVLLIKVEVMMVVMQGQSLRQRGKERCQEIQMMKA